MLVTRNANELQGTSARSPEHRLRNKLTRFEKIKKKPVEEGIAPSKTAANLLETPVKTTSNAETTDHERIFEKNQKNKWINLYQNNLAAKPTALWQVAYLMFLYYW